MSLTKTDLQFDLQQLINQKDELEYQLNSGYIDNEVYQQELKEVQSKIDYVQTKIEDEEFLSGFTGHTDYDEED